MEIKETGTCKHGTFPLLEGCALCIAEREGREGNTEASIAEAVKALDGVAGTALTLRPGEDLEVHCYYLEALSLQEYAKNRVITTVEDSKGAVNDLSVISNLKKQMEAKRKEYLAPLKVQTDAINDTYKFLMEPVLAADKITRDKMLVYQYEQKCIREEQERINALRMEAAKAEMGLNGELSEPVGLVEVIPEPAKQMHTDMGTAGQRMIKKYRVVDFALLPDQYKIENSALLNKVVKAGIHEIPGVEIYEEPIIAVRTSK